MQNIRENILEKNRGQEKINQNCTPLIDAMSGYISGRPAFFRVPGHRFEAGVDRKAADLLGEKAYQADLTEAEGLDDLHHPSGAILEAEQLAAELYGSDRCWFLVNGTTSGNEAMILACVNPGEKILIARNSHRSALQGLILSGAVPVWIQPEVIDEWGTSGPVDPQKISDALEKDQDIRAVYITSPTYYGVCCDVKKIAEICHQHGVPLLVDEAHGSHLYFSRFGAGEFTGEGDGAEGKNSVTADELQAEEFPEGAILCGADLVAQSTHKTCGSMTESSMLHAQGSLVDFDRVDRCLKLVTSTSPNYLLMASLDGARHLLAEKGKNELNQAMRLARAAERQLSLIPGIRVMKNASPDYFRDPLRVVFSAADVGISGYRMHELLYNEGKVSCELSDPLNVVCVITWGNTEDDIRRLADTCQKVVQKYGISCSCDFSSRDIIPPDVRMTPRQAFYSQTEQVSAKDAIGRIAADSVIPYPPGIPIICPGEMITSQNAESIDGSIRVIKTDE